MKRGQIKAQVLSGARSLLGERNVHRVLLTRAYRCYEKVGLIFIHVPKCAGTSVSHALYGRSLGHRTALELRSYAPERFDRLESFAVLREPIERAYSAYLYLLRGGTKSGWAARRAEYEAEPFASFERFATEWLPRQKASGLDYVLQPQTRYVTDTDERVLVRKLIPLDRLSETWPDVVRGRRINRQVIGALNVQEGKPPPPPITSGAEKALREFYRTDVALWESVCAGGAAAESAKP